MEKVVVFGAGNIGRGLLGELFSEAGCEVVFVEVDEPLISALNNAHSYAIRVVGDAAREVNVRNVRAIHAGDVERVADELRTASMAATAVGHANLRHIAPLVAEGMRKRQQQRVDAPLNIIMCENILSVATDFKRRIIEHIRSRSLLEYLDSHLGLVETSVERMVPGANPAVSDRDPLLIVTEPVDNLPLDRQAFLGPIPPIPLFFPVGNIVAYYKKKLFTSNAGHAILGYLGYPRGYEYLADAVADDRIREVVFGSLKESGRALIAEYGFQEKEIESLPGDHPSHSHSGCRLYLASVCSNRSTALHPYTNPYA